MRAVACQINIVNFQFGLFFLVGKKERRKKCLCLLPYRISKLYQKTIVGVHDPIYCKIDNWSGAKVQVRK